MEPREELFEPDTRLYTLDVIGAHYVIGAVSVRYGIKVPADIIASAIVWQENMDRIIRERQIEKGSK